MRIGEYVARQTKNLAASKQRIKDFRVFDFNYIPDEPLMRREAEPLIDACLRYLATGIGNHLFLFGSRGSGKTLIAQYVGRLLAAKHGAVVRYANCRQHNTSFKLLAHLLGVKPRGVGLDELWLRFCDEYHGSLILILDEVDLLSDKDRNKDLLYLLGRSPTRPMVILLSNQPRFLSRLDASIRSSLQPELIHFRNYDALEIRKILEDRAHHGLYRASHRLIQEIAALTAQFTNSDVRVALKTLYSAAIEPHQELRALFDRARHDLVADVLADLNDRNLLIVKSIGTAKETFVKDIYSRYRRLSRQHGEEPFSYPYFYANLSYLQSIGLIMLVSTKVRRAYTNRVQPLFEPTVLEKAWALRFG